MVNQITGPVPAQVFLDEFLPCTTVRPDDVKIPWTKKSMSSEAAMIKIFNKAKKDHATSGAFSSIAIVDSHRYKSTAYGSNLARSPDIGIYKLRPGYPEPPSTGAVDWDTIISPCDRKAREKGRNEDIAIDPPPGADKTKHVFNNQPQEGGVHAKGQLISYATEVFRAQPRTFCLSIIFLEGKARFIRWDRSGGVISELFDCVGTQLLTEFLWRMHHADEEGLGLDPTVSVASQEEAKGAHSKLQDWDKDHPGFITVPEKDEKMWKVQVFDDKKPSAKKDKEDNGASKSGSDAVADAKPPTPRTFVTTRHQTYVDSLTGRATSGYYAVELLEPGPEPRFGDVGFLKDSWRIAEDGIEKEGDTYTDLEDAGVSHISPIMCAGDVLSKGRKQATRTPDFATQTEEHPWICGSQPVRAPGDDGVLKIIHHVHYRIVLSKIGKPLSAFESTKQLCEAIYCAIIAHSAAVVLAYLLHRDISCGNILITPDGLILIDWDLSRKMRLLLGARRTWRTGTWQFMSVALLLRLKKNQEPRDDFESFLWTLLYNVLRYRPTCVKGPELQELVHDIFDVVKANKKGGDGKLAFLENRKFAKKQVRESDLPIPLKNILESLRDLFRPLYSICYEDRANLSAGEQTALDEAETLTSNSEAIEKIFKENLALPGWPSNDKAEDQIPEANQLPLNNNQQYKSTLTTVASTATAASDDSAASGTKRSHDDVEVEDNTSSEANVAPPPPVQRKKQKTVNNTGSSSATPFAGTPLASVEEEVEMDEGPA